MATYNGESYLYRQLASILEQLQYNDEVIISDDGSTDDTLKIIASFQDKRIKLLRNPNERSPVSNFQHALLHASGEYIFLSDQDDIWFPNKVNGVLQILKDYDLVVHDCNLQYKDQIIGNHFKIRKSGKGLFKNLFKNRFLGNCMAFRRGILKYALPFPPDLPMHDMWIGLVATLYGEVCFMKPVLSIWRRHDNSFQRKFRSKISISAKLKFRFILIKNLIRLTIKTAKLRGSNNKLLFLSGD